MPIIDWRLDEGSSLDEVISAINTLIPFINSIDDSNISPSAAIASTKLENGALITAHASRHAVGGADPLPKSSVSGAMIQPRCINSEHIGLGAILASHLASGSVLDSIYLDPSPLTANDGDVPEAPEGYDELNTLILVCGVDFTSAGLPDDSGMRDIIWFINIGQSTICTCKIEDADTLYKGVVSYRRLAFK